VAPVEVVVGRYLEVVRLLVDRLVVKEVEVEVQQIPVSDPIRLQVRYHRDEVEVALEPVLLVDRTPVVGFLLQVGSVLNLPYENCGKVGS
jgi:hypothetical protein